jgi:hypothetical protein
MVKKIDIHKRPIVTTYYEDFKANKMVKITRSLHANSACMNCFNHMQLDHYKALVAEVYDERTGSLHAVFRHKINGGIETIFKREVKEGDYV